jgi:hypothetical protein
MSQSDEDAIRALEHRFNAAWDAHDPDALADRSSTTPSSSPSMAPGPGAAPASAI